MKTTMTLATLALGAALIPTYGFSQSTTEQTTVTTTSSDTDHHYVQDSAITAKIKAKLASEHITSLGRIHVDTDANGKVFLSGYAKSQADIDKAVSIAQGTEHVTSVDNTLAVKADD
jgi:hyperosmotically inducible periplasmic protein